MNGEKPSWKSGIPGKALIGCCGLFVFCFLWSIPLVIITATAPTPIPTELSNLVEMDVEAATETIQPTETRAPTNTAAPTGTPDPTNTTTPTNTSQPAATRTTAPSPTATLGVTARGASCIPDNPLQTGKVVDVVDGDTIKVLLDEDGQTYTVRYIGMDTPESTSQVEYFGSEAAVKNVQLVMGEDVTLIKDVSETDRYGRLLRYVIVDELFVNYELVAQGYANTASFPPDVACISTFQTAEQQARASNLGLWNAPPTQVARPTLAPVVPSGGGGGNAPCNCAGADLDCKDFSSHNSAQACYDYCRAQGYGDPHRLDGNDNDRLACESLP